MENSTTAHNDNRGWGKFNNCTQPQMRLWKIQQPHTTTTAVMENSITAHTIAIAVVKI